MKKMSNPIFFFFLSVFLFTMGTQNTISQNPDEKKNIKQPPSLIVFDASKAYSLQNVRGLLDVELKMSEATTFTSLKLEQDRAGFMHQKMQQFYKNVKVEFGQLILHSKNGIVKSMSSEYYPISEMEVTPRLSNTQAFAKAINHMGASSYLWEDVDASNALGYEKPAGELVILPVYDELGEVTLKLAYKFEIFTIVPVGGGDLYMDANDGNALFFNNRVRHFDNFGHDGRAFLKEKDENTKVNVVETFEDIVVPGNAATRYSGTQTIETTQSGGSYTLNDAGRKVYTRDANNLAPVGSSLPYITNYSQFSDNDNNWTAAEYNNAAKDNAALDAHWGAMMTYDYWSTVHGRNSYDNAGAQLRSYVHVDNNYDNAFWYLNVMSYGDGSSNGNEGNGYFDALTSLDVAGHEIGHAVTEYTANLAYQRESGGLNEAYSDIWGAAIEHFAKGNGNDASPAAKIWLIGDEIDRRSGSAALRSMSDPKSLGQPDTYGGSYWVNPNCGTPTSGNDYCGVHTNSGVLNHWFYLTVAGGSGTNDAGDVYSVAGIGMTKSAHIAYRAISFYMTSNTTYAGARTALIQSAIDLYGAGGAEEQAVTNAMYAVNVGDAYGGGGTSGYCTSASTNVNDEYIGRVQLNTINNASGAQFYSDFTSISTNLTEGQSYTITVTPTWTGTVYPEGYAVWIDYNDDKDFDDAGELVWSKAASTNTPNSGNFTVPTGTSGNPVRMRVSMKYNGIPTACETFTYGEVEDYTVNLISGGGDTQAPSAPTNLSASNITDTSVNLSWTASTDNIGVTGYEVFQNGSSLGTVTGTSASVTGLTAATSYSYNVRAFDAAGNNSALSNTVNITTTGGADTQAPSTPTNLSASNVTDTSVNLSWTASTDNIGVTGYEVFQNGSSLGTVTGTSASVTGLTAGTSYSYNVRAFDAAGNNSALSNTVSVTTTGGGGGSTVLHQGYFESGWDGWIDGGSDAARYAGSNSYEGIYSIQLRDNTSTSTMTLGSFNVSSYSSIDIEFYFRAVSMENGEDFWVQFYDGGTWRTVASYASGSSFNNNIFYVATVNIPNSTYNFPTNAQFRFRCDASGNNDYVYIDQVTITANSGSAPFAGNSITALGGMESFGDEVEFEEDMLLYPNPVSTMLNVKLVDSGISATFRILNVLGQEVLSGRLSQKGIDVRDLQSGVYLIEVNDGEEINTQRFIKN
jgi:bacillolysin